jgi:hypothetical protein
VIISTPETSSPRSERKLHGRKRGGPVLQEDSVAVRPSLRARVHGVDSQDVLRGSVEDQELASRVRHRHAIGHAVQDQLEHPALLTRGVLRRPAVQVETVEGARVPEDHAREDRNHGEGAHGHTEGRIVEVGAVSQHSQPPEEERKKHGEGKQTPGGPAARPIADEGSDQPSFRVRGHQSAREQQKRHGRVQGHGHATRDAVERLHAVDVTGHGDGGDESDGGGKQFPDAARGALAAAEREREAEQEEAGGRVQGHAAAIPACIRAQGLR